ncbi:hypothetical protein PAXRUDRAFT_98741, partial [Paxillus rubicundulus Ve08.2h10]
MQSLDYSTFSLCSALTPSQQTTAGSHPAGIPRHHVAQTGIITGRRHTQRDDLPSSSQMTDDDPRVVTQTLFAYQTQPSSGDPCR